MDRARLFRMVRPLAMVFVAGWLVRSFAVGLYFIPSGSMLPVLWPGDGLLVAKWPYGWSRFGLVGGAPLFAGRLGGTPPVRGDLVVIRDGRRNVVKRVIGLPGERIALRAGTVLIDGRAVPRLRIGDFVAATGAGSRRYRRYVETLPGGASHPVLDGGTATLDRMAERRVPADHLFLLGDNRDDSADSRVAPADGGLGMVPTDRLLGRAMLLFWSTDDTARWREPRSWWRTIRWSRIGMGVE